MTLHAHKHLETKVNRISGGQNDGPPVLQDEDKLAKEARRILRRLSETGAVLALAPDMDKAVVLRAIKDGPRCMRVSGSARISSCPRSPCAPRNRSSVCWTPTNVRPWMTRSTRACRLRGRV